MRCLMQRAAMTIAAHCVGTCTALRFSGQCFPSVRRADPTVQLDLGHRPYNPAHASCIFCFIGAKNTTDVSTHSSPLSKESSPNHQQVTPLCSKEDSPECRQASFPLSKEVLPTVCTFRFIAPSKFPVRQSEAIGNRKSRWPAQSWMGLPPAYCYPPPPRQTESACKRERPGE